MRKMAALLFGNGAYPAGSSLSNPPNDANDLAAKLASYGFSVIVETNATHQTMEKRLKEFRNILENVEVALFFFAGHGVQVDGKNYLIAIDTDCDDETSAKHGSLSLDFVIDSMEKGKSNTSIIILDACRSNPWERRWKRDVAGSGLAPVYAPKGTIIGFATSPGESASDGRGRNGAYTSALLKNIDTPDCSIETMFKRVRNTLASETGGKQTSWEHTSLSGEFYFNIGLSRIISLYKEESLADNLLVLDLSKSSHRIIRGLKSHDWYRQNPALDKLNAEPAAKYSRDNLFVIGRNIYQSACGGAHTAEAFIDNFVGRTSDFSQESRKALLDGMLFEVFFDASAKLRDRVKFGYFQKLFDLERYEELSESFRFIADTLAAANASFYRIPGKNQALPISIAFRKNKIDGIHVGSIFIDGVNALRAGEDGWTEDDGSPYFVDLDLERLKEMLSEQLAIPLRLLEVTFTGEKPASEFGFPMNWTVRKFREVE